MNNHKCNTKEINTKYAIPPPGKEYKGCANAQDGFSVSFQANFSCLPTASFAKLRVSFEETRRNLRRHSWNSLSSFSSFRLATSLSRCFKWLAFPFSFFSFSFFFSVYTSVLLGSLCQLWKMEIISKNYEEGVVHTSTYSQNAGINCASDLRHGSKYMPGQPACRTTVHFFFFLLGLSYF